MFTGTRDDDDIVLAGSPHAHVRARWARPCPCPLDPRMHALTGYARTHAPGPCTHARTGPMHACSHRTPRPLARSAHARTLAPGPHAARTGSHARSLAGSPTPLGLHARTHRVRVPMPARSWGPSRMHALGPHARSLAGSPRTHAPGHACRLTPGPHARSVSMHARTHRAHACMLACAVPLHACIGPMHARSHRAPHARSLAGSPCTCAGSLHSCMLHPMLYVVVICSSSTVLYSSIMQ